VNAFPLSRIRIGADGRPDVALFAHS